MNADELMQKIIANGADEEGIKDRFDGNTALYMSCFQDFLEEPSFAALDEALSCGDTERAFSAAHALKGLSGNLGISAFYEAVCALVEALRAGRLERAGEPYAEALRQLNILKSIYNGTEPPFEAEADAAPKKSEPALSGFKRDSFVRNSVIAIAIAIALVGYMFCRVSVDFRDNVMKESGQHLIEMSNQIKLYVEKQVENDWKVASSISDSMSEDSFKGGDKAIFAMLEKKCAVWEISDLMLYTENGGCVYSSGKIERNDTASDMAAKALERGKFITIVDSTITYTIPVETKFTYGGSRIVAISVVRDMATFLDDMDFSSFDDRAMLYLTDNNGVVISVLTNPSAVLAFNISSVVSGHDITPLDKGSTPEEFFSDPKAAAFLISGGDVDEYGVSVPIYTGDVPLHLFYLVPEEVVNDAMNGFSVQLTSFSMLIIFLFAVLAFLVFLFIYTNRKKMFDKALVSRERTFDLLVNNTRTAFALFSVSQREPIYISSNAMAVVGDKYWALEKVGDAYRMRNDTDTETDALRQANGMLEGWDGKSILRSGYICGRDIPPYYFEFQLNPVEGEEGSFVGIARDVTQAYEREEATRSAMQMATGANEAKSRFLSNMSHDIRTPMNAIMNMTNFALESIDQPNKLGPYLHTIRESSEHLLHLINDVLDMSRIESGRTIITSTPFDIFSCMMKQADMIRPLCEAKGQTLITDLSGLDTQVVSGDAMKLSQILMNLLGNAVKFTPEKGAVRFTAREIPSLSDAVVDVRFTVEDNGIGIPEEDIADIFEPFRRASDSRVNSIEGTGLGLSICKNYVDAMGGTIRCESEQGEGSIFTVELFFQRADAELIENEDPVMVGDTPFLGMHCLVAEDNRINQTIAKTLLERLGFITDFADDGGECLQKFLSAKPYTYDVVYMDLQMPVMDGCQTAVSIRGSRHPQAKTIPIVAMTANIFEEDIERARAAGMDAYFGKPIVSFSLIEQTNKAINKKRGQRK